MTIINICFYDGTENNIAAIAAGMNNKAEIKETILLRNSGLELDELVKSIGEFRVIEPYDVNAGRYNDIYQVLHTALTNYRNKDPGSEFIINISSANFVEAFVSYPIAMIFNATVYVVENNWEIPLNSVPDLSKIDKTKIRILKSLLEKPRTAQDIAEDNHLQYRTVKNASNILTEMKLLEEIENDQTSSKRGPKPKYYKITEVGKLVTNIIM